MDDNGSTIGTGTVSNSVASITTTALTAGKHVAIKAVYNGDSQSASSTSNPLTELVLLVSKITLSITGTCTHRTVTAIVAPQTGTGSLVDDSNLPTEGTVTFTVDNGTPITRDVQSGVASLVVSDLGLGTHIFKAVYSGNKKFAGSSSTVSLTINLLR